MTKFCTKCEVEKDENLFGKSKNWCRTCVKEINDTYYQQNKIRLRERRRDRHKNNKEYDNVKTKQYNQKHKEQILAYKKRYDTNRRKYDVTYRLRGLVSSAISAALRSNSSSKMGESYLSRVLWTPNELKTHLEKQFEPWMTWDNYGKYDAQTWNDNDSSTWVWSIDHIIPQSDLPYANMTDENFQKCWSLENLRPLSAKQNLLDGTKKSKHNLSR